MNTIAEFNAALYLRLSKEDKEKESSNISESIKNQRDLLTSYCVKNNYNICDLYIDDGYSGTSFERPNFCRMIEDIENGRVNLVITKDLSRLGRDYILTGHYIEKYFPEHNVRYIAVNDDIDTYSDCASNDITPFKSVINDMYARDISKKVRTALYVKKQSGKFTCAFAPFGYKKDINNKNHLVIDDKTAECVIYIYSLFLSGENLSSIANLLTSQNITAPAAYKTKAKLNDVCKWNSTTVKNILTNLTYTGSLVQGKCKKVSYKSKKKISVPQANWIITENSHKPIISYDDYLQTQQLLSKRCCCKGENNTSNLLKGIVFCGSCNKPMTISRQKCNRIYLVCSGWKRNSSSCTSHCINYNLLIDAVYKSLNENLPKEVFLSKLGRYEITQLIEKIVISSGKDIIIEFAFSDKL